MMKRTNVIMLKLYFYTQYHLTPNYVHIKVNGTYYRCPKTLDATNTFRLNPELKYKKKQNLNEQLHPFKMCQHMAVLTNRV
jgi:hypothetical protein